MRGDIDITERREVDDAAVQSISNWLVARGLGSTPFADMLAGFCERLEASGMPLLRGMITMRTLHPSIGGHNFVWRRGAAVEGQTFEIDMRDDPDWLDSPVRYMLDRNLWAVRRRLVGPRARLDMPILARFRDEGGTDYYLRGVPFEIAGRANGATGVIASFLTDHPQGFAAADIGVLERLLPRLALTVKGELTREIAETVLDTYVGHEAGARIMQGDIHRGSLGVIDAVILYADLRDFTSVTDAAPRQELAGMLDAYFEAMVPPVIERGGEVLKYLGDGLLATFRLGDRPSEEICAGALEAAYQAERRVHALNRARARMGRPTMALDIAMHVGEVLFGNVGAADRLDFTVIGPAVNEASRIEALCKELDHEVLVSETFAKAATLCADRLVPIGRHALRGVRDTHLLFTIETR